MYYSVSFIKNNNILFVLYYLLIYMGVYTYLWVSIGVCTLTVYTYISCSVGRIMFNVHKHTLNIFCCSRSDGGMRVAWHSTVYNCYDVMCNCGTVMLFRVCHWGSYRAHWNPKGVLNGDSALGACGCLNTQTCSKSTYARLHLFNEWERRLPFTYYVNWFNIHSVTDLNFNRILITFHVHPYVVHTSKAHEGIITTYLFIYSIIALLFKR